MKLLFENWRRFLKESKGEVSKELTEIAANTMSAMDVFRDEGEGNISEAEAGQHEYIMSLASNPNPEVVEKFSESLYAGERAGFLSPYSIEELARMDLYLLDGQNAGFAIKDGDDIVSVHNNSGLKGLGGEFMRKAKEVGGARLDHFDGFLTGLYKRYGFTNVYEIYQWDEQYKPKAWMYEAVDVMNPNTSVYADALEGLAYEDPGVLPNEEEGIIPSGWTQEETVTINPNLKYNSYKHGRPDVIMRKL